MSIDLKKITVVILFIFSIIISWILSYKYNYSNTHCFTTEYKINKYEYSAYIEESIDVWPQESGISAGDIIVEIGEIEERKFKIIYEIIDAKISFERQYREFDLIRYVFRWNLMD